MDSAICLFAFWDWTLPVPLPVFFAAFAVVGYLFGRRTKSQEPVTESQARRELKRARLVARELEQIAEAVRKNLATHSMSIARFKVRVQELSGSNQDGAWKILCGEAEEMLKPTLRLASQISHAYDQIRQQSNHLMTFTEVRTDPLTGVSNRRALDDTLNTLFAMMNRYEAPFSIMILDIDHFKLVNDQRGHLFGDGILKSVSRLLDDNVRETDTLARYGGEEFVIIMPHTPLVGATIFSERLRRMVASQLTITVSIGACEAVEGDNPQTLLARADEALYGAKAAGRNCVFVHNGRQVEAPSAEVLTTA